MYQLDIFADSASVQRTNALIVALSGSDRAASRAAFASLLAKDVDLATRADFEILCEFIRNWPEPTKGQSPLRTADAFHDAVREIETRIVPASRVMGQAADSLLRKCWSDLASWSEAAGLGPEHTECFAAELYLRAGQWPDAIRTAHAVAGGEQRARVQRWLALGYSRSGEAALAKCAFLRHAWLAPRRFAGLLAEMGDAGDDSLARDWRRFQSDLGDLDATWFPAWYAHENDGETMLSEKLPTSDGALAYRLVVALKKRERQGLCPALYEDRARLKRLNDSFFTFYMQQRADPRRRLV